MKENENTQYIFLTKRPENINLKETPDNGWFGVTVTSSKEKTRIDYLRNNIKAKHYHITFEPMFDDVGKLDLSNISWIVIGTETGNRKWKISSKREWVFNIYNQAKEKNIPVFMKEDLLGILNEDEFVQEFPKEFGGIK
jgi:phage protein gp37/gp68